MNSPRAILVLRFSSIGDIVLTTSPVATLRRNFPNARIDFMTLTTFAPLLEKHPLIDRIITIDKTAPIGIIKRLGVQLNTDYDLIIDLHDSLRSKLLRGNISGYKLVVYKKPRWQRFKLFQLHKNDFPKDINQRKLYHNCLKNIVKKFDHIPGSSLYVTPQEAFNAKEFLHQNDINGSYIAVIPGAAWETKLWSPRRYRTVISKHFQKYSDGLVILGSATDKICDHIEIDSQSVINLRGKTDLRQSLAIINGAKLAFGSDTGLVHAAEALGVPAVMIMGPTAVETGGGTFLPQSITLENTDLWCRPCSQNGRQTCYRAKQYCLDSILDSHVNNAIDKICSKP